MPDRRSSIEETGDLDLETVESVTLAVTQANREAFCPGQAWGCAGNTARAHLRSILEKRIPAAVCALRQGRVGDSA